MSDSSTKPWSDNPYAPRISHSLYYTERTDFIGTLILAVLYGIIIVLFFQCMGALFSPANRTRGGIQWGLVVHTVTIFLVVTMLTVPTLAALPITYIAYREFPGVRGGEFPGPWGYWANVLYFKPINAIPNTMFLLNNWLADGILLYRCWVIYANNYWIISFPCLMYLVSIGMGAAYTYVQPDINHPETFVAVRDFGISYFSVSLSLNVILTFMIIARICLYNRDIQQLAGGAFSTAGIYNAVVTMLVESFALYAGSFLLFIATWGAGDAIQNVFYQFLSAAQAIAPFLIILRVANRRALTSETVLSGTDGTLQFQSGGGSTLDSGTLPDEYPMDSMGTNGEARVIEVKATIGDNSPTVAHEVS